MQGSRDQSPAVNAIKWLCILQLIISVIIFIVTIVMFAVDFDDHKPGVFFLVQILLAVILALMGMGAGIAGCGMSKFESLTHNQSRKSLTMSMCLMTVFAALFYMIFAGAISFYDVDNTNLDERTKNYRAAFAMVVVVFILGFIEMLFAVFTVILCVIWNPNKKVYKYQQGPAHRGYRDYDIAYNTTRDRSSYIKSVPPSYGPSPYERAYGGY